MINNFTDYNNFLFFLRPSNEIDKALQTKGEWLNIYYRTLSNVLLGLFKYDGLSNVAKKNLQLSYFNSMYIGAFKKDDVLLFTPLIPVGNQNMWGEYSNYNAVLSDGTQMPLNLDDVVVGTNVTLPTISDSLLVYKFSELLAEIKLSVCNNVILSRKSAILETENPNGVNELLTAFNNHAIGSPVAVQKQRTTNSTKVLSFTDITDTTEYYNNFRDVINDFLITVGLNSLVNPNKKERLVVSETETTDDIKNTLLLNRIENRVDFINEVNKKFSTDIKVTFNSDIVNDVESMHDMFNERSEEYAD